MKRLGERRRTTTTLTVTLLRFRALALMLVVAGLSPMLSAGCRSDSLPALSAADDTSTFEYDFVIPDGTNDRLDAGEVVEIVPAELEVRVGESIRIVNEDDADHVVGVFFVPAKSELKQSFNAPGELVGECDIHPSGSFTLKVNP